MAELKPCECGSRYTPEIIHLFDDPEIEKVYKADAVRVGCLSCFARTDWYSTEKQAIDAWNKRREK